MNLFVVFVLSIISILFLLVGTIIVFTTGNNKKIVTFSVSLGFSVLILLGLFHLLPDAYEFIEENFNLTTSVGIMLLVIALGFGLIYFLDKVGGHHHEHDEEQEEGHFNHISIITCIFLIVHNLLEGMTIYSTALLDYRIAVMLTIGIGLHNVPLGFSLSSTYYKEHSKLSTVVFISLIGVSYLFGALIAYFFSDFIMKGIVFGVLLTFTFGMVLYIAVNEFLPHMFNTRDKKYRNLGFILGILLMLVTLFIKE